MTVLVAPIPWLQSDRPSTASTADAADLNVPAKEAAKLLLSSLMGRIPSFFLPIGINPSR